VSTTKIINVVDIIQTYPGAVMVHLEYAFSADRTMMTPIWLNLRALGTVSDLALDGPHDNGDVFGDDKLLKGRLRVSRRFDGVELFVAQLERARNLARRRHHNLIVGPETIKELCKICPWTN